MPTRRNSMTSWMVIRHILFLCIYVIGLVRTTLPQAHQEGVLRRYKSYADVTLFHYYVPPEASVATFEFAAFMDSAKCPVREAFIHIQHGSYPVMSVDNATFPSHFWINRTFLQKLVVRSSFNTHDASVIPIYNPLPGNWFAAAYLNSWDQKVQQEGLGHKCRYSLGSVGLWSLTPDVYTIPLKSRTRLVSAKHFTYYKFYIPSGVVSFTMKVEQCTFLTNHWRFQDDLLLSPGTDPNSNSSSRAQQPPCIHNVFMRDKALPFYKSNQTNSIVTSSENSSFIHVEKLPSTDVYYYLLVVSEGKVAYNVTILVQECPLIAFSKPLLQEFSGVISINANASASVVKNQVVQFNMSVVSNFTSIKSKSDTTEDGFLPSPTSPLLAQQKQQYTTAEKNDDDGNADVCPCIPSFRLTRIRHAQDFSDTFLLEGKEWFTTWLALTDRNPHSPSAPHVVGTSFELLPFIDIGGTLSIGVHLDELLTNATKQSVHVEICVQQGRRPGTYCCDYNKNATTASCCQDGIHLQVSSKTLDDVDDLVYIPFPESDMYYMSFKMHCEFDGTIVPCALPEALISLDIRTQPCVFHSRSPSKGPISTCGEFGYCQEVHKSQYFYTSCRCVAGYKGWACDDDTDAVPKDVLLTTTLLLTLSNIFFIPAIGLALSRRMVVQAFIYFCTMISSTLYHACDQELYSYCLTRYSVLQFCDFFCSILSFWVTIIAIPHSPLDHEYDSFLYIFGSVVIAVGVEYNRTGLLVFVVPFAIGFAYIVFVWVYWSVKRRNVVIPKVGRLLLFIPGVLLGASGLILFAFVETEDNYRYTHSAWHAIIAISLLYLLPKRRPTSSSSFKIQMQRMTTANGNNGGMCSTSTTAEELSHVNNIATGDYQQSSGASPVFFITSELDHLVQDRPQ